MIPLTQDRVALVDDEDFERLSKYNWTYSHSHGRARCGNSDMSHIVLQTEHMIDHKDGVKLNCQKSNLRLCTQTQNCHNRRKTKHKTSSKYKGVSPHFCKGWQAIIGYQNIFGQSIKEHLGTFSVEEEAAKAYDQAARLYHSEFAALNFPGEGERSCLS